MSNLSRNMLVLYGIIILNLVIHFPVLQNEIINWKDDDLFSVLNVLSHQSSGHYWEYTAQFPSLLFYAVQFSVGGNGHFLYHAVSLLLHTVNASLLFFLVLRFGGEWKTAVIISLLFSLHPLQVETIAWISKQPLLLTTTLMLGTIYCLLGFYRDGSRRLYYIGMVIGAVFLITTPMIGALLIIVGIARYYRRIYPAAFFKPLLPFFLFFGTGVLNTLLQSGGESSITALFNESHRMMQENFINHVWKLLWPLSSFQTPPINSNPFHPMDIIDVFFFCSVLCLALITIKNDVLRYCAVLSMCLLLPVLSGVGHDDSLLTESSYYLASIPFFVGIGYGFAQYGFTEHTKRSVFFSVLIGLYLFVCGYQSFKKSDWWKTSDRLWTEALAQNPDNIFVLNKIGMFYFSHYEYGKAKRHIDKALAVNPHHVQSRFHRGLIEYEQMDLDSAIADLQMVVRSEPFHQLALYHLALAHNEYSRYDSVIAYCTRAIQAHPQFVQALNNRGNTYSKMGRLVEANVDYDRVLALDPTYGDGYGNRALLNLQAGNSVKALKNLKKQVEVSPYRIDARIHYALTSILSEDTITAKLSFSEARKLDSTNSELYLKSVINTFLRSTKSQHLAKSVFGDVIDK